MIVSEEQMKKIEEFALEKVSQLDYNHNQDHSIRAAKLAVVLAKKENADVEVCKVAALLHDIGQSVQSKDHEEIGTNMAREFLKSLNLPEDFIEKVCHAIRCHQTSYIKNAKTIEAKIIYDADKLQVVGVFGFCRMISEFLAFKKLPLKEAMKKLEETQEERLSMFQTESAKEMIKEPHKFMKEFYELYKKWDNVD